MVEYLHDVEACALKFGPIEANIKWFISYRVVLTHLSYAYFAAVSNQLSQHSQILKLSVNLLASRITNYTHDHAIFSGLQLDESSQSVVQIEDCLRWDL